MGMYSGSFNVIDSNSSSSSSEQSNVNQPAVPQATAVKAGGSCAGGGCGCGQKPQRQAALDTDKTPAVSAEQKRPRKLLRQSIPWQMISDRINLRSKRVHRYSLISRLKKTGLGAWEAS